MSYASTLRDSSLSKDRVKYLGIDQSVEEESVVCNSKMCIKCHKPVTTTYEEDTKPLQSTYMSLAFH